jgi:hypothetical protein
MSTYLLDRSARKLDAVYVRAATVGDAAGPGVRVASPAWTEARMIARPLSARALAGWIRHSLARPLNGAAAWIMCRQARILRITVTTTVAQEAAYPQEAACSVHGTARTASCCCFERLHLDVVERELYLLSHLHTSSLRRWTFTDVVTDERRTDPR